MIITVPSLSANIFMWASASVGVIVTLTLIAMLVQKEFVSSLDGVRASRIARALGISIIPLSMIFLTSIVIRIMTLLR